ncbi:PREDICTED: multivesicular body subunit 12B-like isoform X3 [Priapulus caudatus]|uniref:Multivesicular body subunit 12B-like isoform X3 n=1 Tax=Priapulus caudatus TaxID=37621 RepID=A0ABM1DZX3_PRICU|nr:PREDICTED: multivesicular body subunit 12B-like isoform X3 [Priapulus caudatus]
MENPITGLCVVTDRQNCPTGYTVIDKTFDNNIDADLWKDGFFSRRMLRYLCITRHFPLENGTLNNVLADIAVLGERSPVPQGYSLVDLTVDTRERAMKKKQLVVMMLPRDSASSAVCEVIILSRMRRPPAGYTIAGEEIGSMCICFKYGPVPPDTQKPSDATNVPDLPYSLNPSGYLQQNTYRPAPLPPVAEATQAGSSDVGQAYPVPIHREDYPINRQESTLARQYTGTIAKTPLQGLPFQINPRLQTDANQFCVPDLDYMSTIDIDSKFCYDFRVERSAI